MSAYIVTGAGGFVGGAAARALVDAGHRVIATDLAEPAVPGATNIGGNLADEATIRALSDAASGTGHTLIHAAALMNTVDTRELWRANVEATRLLLEWAKVSEARRVVFLSSGGVYGYAAGHLHEEDGPLAPVGFYGHTKLIGEQMAAAYAEVASFDAVSLRLFFPFGPGQKRGVFSFIEKAVREGLPVTLNPGGAPRMNPIHVDDLADLIVRTTHDDATCGEPHVVYNAAGPDDVSFGEALELFARAHGTRPVVTEGAGDPSVTDMMGSMRKAARELGWTPSRGVDTIVPSYLRAAPASADARGAG